MGDVEVTDISGKELFKQGKNEMISKLKSLFCSWHHIAGEFKEQWTYLNTKEPAEEQQGRTIWQTRFKDVQLLSVPSGSEGSFRIAFKSYREKRFFRYFFRPSLAAREAAGFELVKSLGIPAVEVLAFGERRIFGHLLDAFFITKYEENTETLLFFASDMRDRESLLKLLKENIRYLAKLHAAGFIHGGAHPRNFLWRKHPEGTLESLWIDLASCRKAGHGKRYWKYILTDLSDITESFDLTQDELEMLMREYQELNPLSVCYKLRSDRPGKFSRAVRI